MDFIIEPFYKLGIGIWNIMLALIGAVATETPMNFSHDTWSLVVHELYPWFLGIGTTLLNIFYFIGIIRQSGNLRENMTLEWLLDICIKLLIANALMTSGIVLMREMFGVAREMTGDILSGTPISFSQSDMDFGAELFYAVFGIIFFAVCLVCSVTIFLVVYRRFLQLYLLVLMMPIAMSTLPGGNGVSHSAYSWLRYFLSKTFSIVVIVLTIVISAKMCGGIDFGQLSGDIGTQLDGAIEALQNMFIMILLTASVSGTDAFMHRALGI